jgi:hypothetical protein
MINKNDLNPLGKLLLFNLNILSSGLALTKILYSTPHRNDMKNSSQINGSRIQKMRRCIKNNMN